MTFANVAIPLSSAQRVVEYLMALNILIIPVSYDINRQLRQKIMTSPRRH